MISNSYKKKSITLFVIKCNQIPIHEIPLPSNNLNNERTLQLLHNYSFINHS